MPTLAYLCVCVHSTHFSPLFIIDLYTLTLSSLQKLPTFMMFTMWDGINIKNIHPCSRVTVVALWLEHSHTRVMFQLQTSKHQHGSSTFIPTLCDWCKIWSLNKVQGKMITYKMRSLKIFVERQRNNGIREMVEATPCVSYTETE